MSSSAYLLSSRLIIAQISAITMMIAEIHILSGAILVINSASAATKRKPIYDLLI